MKHAPALGITDRRDASSGKIGPAKCLCYRGWDAMWVVTKDGAVCSHCGEERRLSSSPTAILVQQCYGCGEAEATWFVTAKGDRICSSCGEKR